MLISEARVVISDRKEIDGILSITTYEEIEVKEDIAEIIRRASENNIIAIEVI
ncbi:hypothetical protein V7138_21545 [Bacillus sp. JJ1533]|uniref:hypothetical protein n=1 Tax=Bacillus sp. JJ1533 TaxID=3122959 RepID=UPI00300058E0